MNDKDVSSTDAAVFAFIVAVIVTEISENYISVHIPISRSDPTDLILWIVASTAPMTQCARRAMMIRALMIEA